MVLCVGLVQSRSWSLKRHRSLGSGADLYDYVWVQKQRIFPKQARARPFEMLQGCWMKYPGGRAPAYRELFCMDLVGLRKNLALRGICSKISNKL